MRKKIVAGNWKMNHDLSETESFLGDFKKQLFPEDVSIMIAPSFTHLFHAFQSLKEHPVQVVAQNMHEEDSGAYTGEVSGKMLKSVGISTVILGHSERRTIFGESHEVLKKKVDAALKNEMNVIFCVGESLEDRKNTNQEEVVKKQLEASIFHLDSSLMEHIIIAYEPIWAIGTGETATPEQAQEMHRFIRNTIREKYSDAIADSIQILYGGSVKPDNAKTIFSQEDVDGGLIGGASLKVESFMQIVNAASHKKE